MFDCSRFRRERPIPAVRWFSVSRAPKNALYEGPGSSRAEIAMLTNRL